MRACHSVSKIHRFYKSSDHNMLPSNVDVDIEVKIIIIDCTDDSDDDLKIMKIMTMMIKE